MYSVLVCVCVCAWSVIISMWAQYQYYAILDFPSANVIKKWHKEKVQIHTVSLSMPHTPHLNRSAIVFVCASTTASVEEHIHLLENETKRNERLAEQNRTEDHCMQPNSVLCISIGLVLFYSRTYAQIWWIWFQVCTSLSFLHSLAHRRCIRALCLYVRMYAFGYNFMCACVCSHVHCFFFLL